MLEHQEHFGRKFYQDKVTGYWISTDYPRIRAHRWVWNQLRGKIPKNCHIHHRDRDKSNNDIENLEMLSFAEHAHAHMTEERSNKASKWMDEIRPLTKEWHASEEGKAWHRYHAEKHKFGKWEAKSHKCIVCNLIYSTTKRSNLKFCSNKCKSKFRRDTGVDNIVKICPICNLEFDSNKYAKNIYCSRLCAQQRDNRNG